MSGTVERAFELARSGTCQSLNDLRKRLKSERHEAIEAHITGTLAAQLRELIKAARNS